MNLLNETTILNELKNVGMDRSKYFWKKYGEKINEVETKICNCETKNKIHLLLLFEHLVKIFK